MSNLSFFEDLEETFHGGDPELRTWFLVKSTYWPMILCGLYVLSVKVIGPSIMKDRKPLDLRLPMLFYNLFLVIAYTISIANVVYIMLFEEKKPLCSRIVVSKNDYTYRLAFSGWVIYLLKYVEFLDTIFFVLRKKDNLITNLHVSHHALLPIFGWILFRTETSGFQAYPIIINSIVHIVMYSYYALAAMGPKVRKYLWWKRYLTIAQMVQFVMIVGFVVIVMPLTGCTAAKTSVIIDVFGAVFFFTLFYNFYQQTFKAKTSVKIRVD